MAGEEAESGEDKTENPTPRRLERARESGQVAHSREVTTFASLSAAALAIGLIGPAATGHVAARLAALIAHAQPGDPAGALQAAAGAAAILVLSLLAPPLVLGVAATMLQTRFLVSAKPLVPDPRRISPVAGAKRVFGSDNLIEVLKALAKIALLSCVAWHVLSGSVATLSGLLDLAPTLLGPHVGEGLLRLIGAVLCGVAILAGLDLLWVQLRHTRRLGMTRQDVRQELKETEGDPHLKARLRQIRQTRSRRRMMAAVPKAQVVITNPTRYAVALSYKRGSDHYKRGSDHAPVLVAKGTDLVAARIRTAAEKAGVPLVANPPLARALHKLPLDTAIPPEHYRAVAEIIAFVWGLSRERPPPSSGIANKSGTVG